MEEVLKLISTRKATAWWQMTQQIPQRGRGHCMFTGGSHLYGAKHAAPPRAAGVTESGTW